MPEGPSRRGLLRGGAAAALMAALLAGCGRNVAARTDTVRIAYQRDGVLVIAKQQKRLEPRLSSLGVYPHLEEAYRVAELLFPVLGLGDTRSVAPLRVAAGSPRGPTWKSGPSMPCIAILY